MTLVARIAHEIATDDIDQSERLIRTYQGADEPARKIADDLFTCLCGYTLATLIREEGGEPDEDEDAKACALLDLSQPCDLPRYVVARVRIDEVREDETETTQVAADDETGTHWAVYHYAAGVVLGDAEPVEDCDKHETAAGLAQRLADENGGVFLARHDAGLLAVVRAAARIEVQPCCLVYEPDFKVSVERASAETVEFWGVYARTPDEDGAELAHHLFDVPTRERAEELAQRVACGLPVTVSVDA